MASQYRLRASGPMPIAGSSVGGATSNGSDFILQTFGAESNQVDVEDCVTTLPTSSDFRGQGLGGDLISANYSRIGDRTGDYFQGRKVHKPVYVDEGSYNLLS